MIAQWMLGAVAFSLLCGVAALAAERGLRALGRPTRVVWTIALLVGSTWPVVARFLLVTPIETAGARVAAAITVTGNAAAGSATAWLSALWLRRLDVALETLWIIASTLLLVQVVRAIRTLARVQREGQRVDVDGERVLIDDTLGPAVIGLAAPTIVIPSWLLSMDDVLRTLVLRHEREHCRVRDPALVWLSVVVTTLLPWNLALWWMSRRLRLAMEIDCDTRTVRGTDDRTRYAKLLLLIAQRKASARFVPMLSDSHSQLSRRISAMHNDPVRHPLWRASLAAGVAILAVAAACSTGMTTNLLSPTPKPGTSAGGEAVAATSGSVALIPGDHMATMLTNNRGPAYPSALRAAKVTGNVVAQYVVNADGMIDTLSLKVLTSSDPAFTAAVREALTSMRYAAARVGGKAVRQLVQQNFLFDQARGDGVAFIRMPLAPRDGQPPSAPIRVPDGTPYFDFQVEKPAVARAGSAGPAYPPQLREARVEGVVIAQFVVDTTGRVDMATYKVLKSDNDLFSGAVRAALTEMQFDAAMVGGRPVKQLLQQPFAFRVPPKSPE